MVAQTKMDFQKVNLYAQMVGGELHVSGDTWLRRKLLAAEGGQWSKGSNAWVFKSVPKGLDGMLTWLPELSAGSIQVQIESAEPAALAQEASETPTAPKVVSVSYPAWYVAPSWGAKLVKYIKWGRPAIAIVGPTGNGKTTATEETLKALGVAFIAISCNDQLTPLDLVGGRTIVNGSEAWVDGPVTKAFREGKAIMLDEADTLDPRTAMCLQNVLQDAGADGKARYINTPEGRVYPAGACPVILCMNTVGSGANRQYSGRNALDLAMLDRLSFIQTGYENEVDIIAKRGYGGGIAKRVVEWAESTRQKIDASGLRVSLSPRTLLRVAQQMACGEQWEAVIEDEFFSRLSADVVQFVK
jgi:hypothetical protein